MQHIILKKSGPASVLELETITDITEIANNEVLIDVHYSGINFADIMMRLGLYGDAPKFPFVPGYEVSGIVKKVGSLVTHVKINDQVVAGTMFGGYASLIKVPGALVFKLPKHLNLAEAAALMVNWATAYSALIDMARVKSGDRVLIDAATGGVGTIALQMLKKLGAKSTGLTSSKNKLDYIENLGAVAMTQHDFLEKKNQKFDVILNSQGGASVRKHFNQLAATGRVIAFGLSSAIVNGKRDWWELLKAVISMPIFPLLTLFSKNRGIYGLNVLTLLQDADFVNSLADKWTSVEKYEIRPFVDKIFPAKNIAEAHQYLETKQARGKVLISWR